MPVVAWDMGRLHAHIGRNVVDQQAVIDDIDAVPLDFTEQLFLFERRDKPLLIFFENILSGFFPALLEKARALSLGLLLPFFVPGAVFDKRARLDIHIIQIEEILHQRADDIPVDGACGQSLLIGSPCLVALFSDALEFRHIHAHAEQAQSAAGIMELHLRRSELARIALCVGHVLKEHIGRIHGQRFLIILLEVLCRGGIEELHIRQADHIGGRGFVCIFRKALVAVEICAGHSVLGEIHRRHVVQQGALGFLLLLQLFGQMMQVGDIGFEICRHAAEGARQNADLIVLVIIEGMLIVSLPDLLRHLCELPQRLCDPSGKARDEGDERRQQDGKDDDDPFDPALPARVDLLHGNRHDQAVPVAEGMADGHLFHIFILIADDFILAGKSLRRLRERFHRHDVHMGMIDHNALSVIHKGIAVFVQRDVVNLLGHKGVIQLNADHAHEFTVQINRRVVGDDTRVQIVGDVRGKPDGSARRFGYGEPDKLRGVRRIIACDIGHLMLPKALAVGVDKPEALHL